MASFPPRAVTYLARMESTVGGSAARAVVDALVTNFHVPRSTLLMTELPVSSVRRRRAAPVPTLIRLRLAATDAPVVSRTDPEIEPVTCWLRADGAARISSSAKDGKSLLA